MKRYTSHRCCTAPMLGITDRHFRRIVRFLSSETLTYTELVHSNAITVGQYSLKLADNAQAAPTALQLIGNIPQDLGAAAAIASQYGFTEINFNAGCPSPRGVSGNFGLCLMDDPTLTAACIKACCQASPLPVSLKCRLGSRFDYSWNELLHFIDLNAQAGCRCFIVHARKADMNLDTRKNRSIPPLEYEKVYRLKELYPELEWVINGDIKNNQQALEHLKYVDGVMMGRSLYHNIYLLSEADSLFFNIHHPILSRQQLIENKIIPYAEQVLSQGMAVSHVVRHILGLYQYQPRANVWRRFLAENAYKPGTGVDVIRQALKIVNEQPSETEHSLLMQPNI
ncbi:MAG: tRNA dihydrouridine(20/20a) synthase DusA [Candidatus Bruticola sp.]